jgi:hypothetical protein
VYQRGEEALKGKSSHGNKLSEPLKNSRPPAPAHPHPTSGPIVPTADRLSSVRNSYFLLLLLAYFCARFSPTQTARCSCYFSTPPFAGWLA